MSRLVLLLLAALCAVAIAEEDSDVIELDADSFDDGVANEPTMLVEFYAPWCGHCKRLAPEYEIAATELKKNDPPIPLAKVDCPANNELCGRFGVTGYPTLKIFRGGSLSADYNGPRSSQGIISYMKKQAGPSARELADSGAVKAFIENEEHSIIGFFPESETESKVKFAFKANADKMRDDFRFGMTSNPEALEEYGYSDQVVIFRPPAMNTKMEESRVVVEGDDMYTFLREQFMGIAGVRNRDNEKFYEKRPLAVVYFNVDYVRNAKGSNYWRNRVIKVAKDFVGQVNFAVSDKAEYSNELEALGLDKDADVVAGVYDSKGKYAMTEKFSVDTFRTFIQQYLDGEIELYIKSEPIPEDDGPVKVVVGRNFEEIVNDESKDVMIEFYAPWCGHCKALAPKYEELAEKLSGNSNIVIAKSDATANDYPPGFEVRGYPTIYWVPAGKKDSPQKYEGGREVSDFISFIKKNATNKPVVVEGEEAKEDKKKKKKSKPKKEDL